MLRCERTCSWLKKNIGFFMEAGRRWASTVRLALEEVKAIMTHLAEMQRQALESYKDMVVSLLGGLHTRKAPSSPGITRSTSNPAQESRKTSTTGRNT